MRFARRGVSVIAAVMLAVALMSGRASAAVTSVTFDIGHSDCTAPGAHTLNLFLNDVQVASVPTTDGCTCHENGMVVTLTDASGKSLWIPVAEYRANSSAVIQRRNKDTHALELQFTVPDHIGCIAVTPEFLIGGNWDSRIFYFWTHEGKLVRKVISSTGNAYQDMKFEGGHVVAGGVLADRSGAVDWLDLKTMNHVHRMNVGRTDRGAPFTREGMSIRGKEIVFLPEDSPSRLFLFTLGR